MLVGLQIEMRLAPRLVTPEVTNSYTVITGTHTPARAVTPDILPRE
jgi:hypothetical protein